MIAAVLPYTVAGRLYGLLRYRWERQSEGIFTDLFYDSAVETNKEATVAMRVPKSMILWGVAVSGLLFVLFPTCPAQESHLVATGANPRFADTQSNEGEHSKLPPNALQMARIIGVESDIEKLSSLAAAGGAGAAPGLSFEELSLRQQITDAVVAAALDVDSVAAEVDYEREQTVELRSLWRYKRDRAIGSTNLAVLAAGTGLGIVSGLLQFSKTTSSRKLWSENRVETPPAAKPTALPALSSFPGEQKGADVGGMGGGRSNRSPGFSPLEAEDRAAHQHQRGRQGSQH